MSLIRCQKFVDLCGALLVAAALHLTTAPTREFTFHHHLALNYLKRRLGDLVCSMILCLNLLHTCFKTAEMRRASSNFWETVFLSHFRSRFLVRHRGRLRLREMTLKSFRTAKSPEVNGTNHPEPPDVARGRETTRVIAVAGVVGVTGFDDLGRGSPECVPVRTYKCRGVEPHPVREARAPKR